MAEIKAGAPFGMDGAMLSKIDWNLALKRITQDLRTDFIYAPHLSFIYSKAGDELIAQVETQLRGEVRGKVCFVRKKVALKVVAGGRN